MSFSSVHRLLEEHERQYRNQLIAALPSATLGAAKKIGSVVEAAVLDHMGEQHGKLRSLNGRKMAEMDVDLHNQREQIRGLLSRIDAKDAEIAELEGDKHDLRGQLDLATAEIDSLKERVAAFEREEDFKVRMLAMMKETMGQQPKATD